MKREGAFTLVEVLITFLIISIILSYSILNLQGIKENIYLQSNTRRVLSAIRKSQQLAFNNHEKYYLKVIGDGKLIIFNDTEIESEIYIKNCIITNNFSADTATFSPMGTASSGSFFININSNNKRIYLSYAGRVRVE